MIPLVFSGVLIFGRVTFQAISIGAISGATYACGRKIGRLACEKLDFLESSISENLSER